MRLTRIIIENFRGIRRLKLYLDPVTVIIGENNHGKTSIFDVLGLCLGRPSTPLPTHFRANDFHRDHRGGPPQPIRISLTFEQAAEALLTAPSHGSILAALSRDRDGRDRLRVEFWARPDEGRIEHRFVDQEGKPLDPQPPASALAELRRLHPVLLLRFAQRVSGEPLSEDAEGPGARAEKRGRRELENQVARVYHELADTRGPIDREHLQRGLTAAHDLYEGMWTERVRSRAPISGVLEQLVPGEGETPGEHARALEQAGSGSHTLALLMVLGAMLDGRGAESLPADAHPVIAIEEPEVHLHPILLASTWDVIESLNAQTLVTTNSGELLSSVPMSCIRRLTRRDGRIDVHRLDIHHLSPTELRRVGYHVRAKRGSVLFARCWLLVEGETEFWLLRQLAHVLGYDLEAEGVRCLEFAQCGVPPLVKVANDLGIEWHLLTDGDESGAAYAHDARQHLNGAPKGQRVSRLQRRDIERCFWYHGYADVYREAAGLGTDHSPQAQSRPPGKVIHKAVRAYSKPYLALTVAEEAALRGPDGVPPVLRNAIETVVDLARNAVRDGTV